MGDSAIAVAKKDFGDSCSVNEIQFGEQVYKYYLSNCLQDECVGLVRGLENVDSCLIICDKSVENLYGKSLFEKIRSKLKCDLISFDCGEKSKNLKVLEGLIEKALSYKVTRRTCIIALGGGICGNMAGMVAALLFRGLKFVHIPTTLMGMLDSVLSLKQAINSDYGKNLIGTFYKPEMVIANIDYLMTLPKREVVSGICEVIKNSLAILPDSIDELYDILDKECKYSQKDYQYLIETSIKAKMLVMKNDPYEKHSGLILEYGHTVGHAIELATKGGITHGEAIGLGMLCAARISNSLGYLSEEDMNLHEFLLEKAGAPVKIPIGLKSETILSIMKFDNKRGYLSSEKDVFHMVLLEKKGKPVYNGNMVLTSVLEDIVEQAINSLY